MENGEDSGEETPVPFGTFRPVERRALIACAFASGCTLLMPQEFIGAGISFTLALALYLWHRRRSKKEAQLPSLESLPLGSASALTNK